MRSPTRDRQIISILSALVIHGILVLMLGLVDLGQDITDEQRLGPVAVRFEPVPSEALQQAVEPPEPEEPITEPQEPEEPATESQEPAAEPQASEPAEPAAAPQQPESPQRHAAAAAEEEWSIPTPSGREIPDTERMRAPREPSSEQPPASRSLEGRTDRNVAPEQQQGNSEGSRITYAEEPPETRETDRRQADSDRTAENSQEGSQSVFDQELLEELESVQASEEGAANGEAEGGEGTATGTSTTVRTEDGGNIVYALEGENSTRELLRSSLPELSQEEVSGLPGRVEVVVSFTLPPNGRPMDLKIERSSSSIPVVDAKVKQAVQTWEFSDAPRDAEPVRGMARIIIRAAD
ncbi:MAG: energy transducer TonB [Spirochaetia bacterium]|nr:energy transducer TonB [Spirochaetia bacterium]